MGMLNEPEHSRIIAYCLFELSNWQWRHATIKWWSPQVTTNTSRLYYI